MCLQYHATDPAEIAAIASRGGVLKPASRSMKKAATLRAASRRGTPRVDAAAKKRDVMPPPPVADDDDTGPPVSVLCVLGEVAKIHCCNNAAF